MCRTILAPHDWTADDGVVQGWDIASRKERLLFQLPKTDDILPAIALAPGGKTLAYAVRWVNGTQAGPVWIFDVATGKELQLRRHGARLGPCTRGRHAMMRRRAGSEDDQGVS